MATIIISAAIGAWIGGCLGFLAASLLAVGRREDLQEQLLWHDRHVAVHHLFLAAKLDRKVMS